jgi:hypothetical protein
VREKGAFVSLAAAAVAAVIVAAPAIRSSSAIGVVPLRQAPPTFPGPLLGFAYGSLSTRLTRIDPTTLRPLPARSQTLPGVIAWAASPDRSRLAIAECGRAYVTVTAPSGYQHQRVVDLRMGRALSTAAFDWPRLLLGDSDPSNG